MAPSTRVDRLLRICLVASAVLLVALLPIAVLTYFRASEGTDTSNAIARNGELIACRSGLFTEVSRAQTDLDSARTQLEVVTARLFAAALAQNTVERDAAGALLTPTAQMIEAATAKLEQVQTKYENGVSLSRTNPDMFILECRKPGV